MIGTERTENGVDTLLPYAEDILRSAGFNAEHAYMQHGAISCYTHSLSVAQTALRLAEKFSRKADRRAVVRGALLHDYFLYDWHEKDASHKWHGFHHADAALKNAERDFPLSPVERDIIYSHMFPLNLRFPKYRESLFVCLADKICAFRETVFCRKPAEKEKQ